VALRAAVFDFDGVLVDSEPLHFRSLQDALLSDGVPITREEYWSVYLAYDDRGAVRRALEHHGEPAPSDRVSRIVERKVARFEALMPEVPVFPGARELVGSLAARIPLAIASGARRTEIDEILRAVHLRDAFVAIVGAEDAVRSKPDPAPYLEAAARVGGPRAPVDPACCLAIEDSMPGIASALGAGMKVVGVAHSYPSEKLQAAHRVVRSLVGLEADGLAELFNG
jgi:beta-phosphoglucomutase